MASRENTLISPFLGSFMTILFMFSTIYGLAYLYYQGSGQTFNTPGIGISDKDASSLSFIGLINSVLDVLSWISPFALVRGLILYIAPHDLYVMIDLFFLRPISWVVSIFTAGYIKSWIPTLSGEV